MSSVDEALAQATQTCTVCGHIYFWHNFVDGVPVGCFCGEQCKESTWLCRYLNLPPKHEHCCSCKGFKSESD